MFEDKIPNGLTYCRTIKVFKHNGINTKRQFLITMSKNRKQSFVSYLQFGNASYLFSAYFKYGWQDTQPK